MQLKIMEISDYEGVLALWKSIEGFYIREIDDSLLGMQKFLERNPSTNVVALLNGDIVGSILCGYDGRCAYMYHVCVRRDFRHQGIGSAMVDFCISQLKEIGATHINLVAFKSNEMGNLFWNKLGWDFKGTLNLYEYILDSKNVRKLNT